MGANYQTIFLKKTGMYNAASSYTEEEINDCLDEAAILVSRNYATPWGSFSEVPEKYKYGVVIFAAIEYWWSVQSSLVEIGDVHVGASGSSVGLRVATKFDRAVRMIADLTEEYEEIMDIVDGSGSILVGDLLRRSKQTGRLVPYADDPKGNWLS